MLELYKNIRDRRIMLDMSQDELARRTGYTSRASISRIEKGEIDLPQSKIVAFAKALDTTPGDLMGWDEPTQEEKENGYNIGTMLHDPIKMQIMNIVAGMSDEEAKALLTLLRK